MNKLGGASFGGATGVEQPDDGEKGTQDFFGVIQSKIDGESPKGSPKVSDKNDLMESQLEEGGESQLQEGGETPKENDASTKKDIGSMKKQLMKKFLLQQHGKGGHKSHTLELIQHMQEEPEMEPSQRFMSRILHNHYFDYLMGAVIMFNMFAMIIETDRTVSVKEEDSDEGHWTETVGWIVLSIFGVELVARLYVHRWSFWQDVWNVFDFFVVTIDLIFSLVGLVAGDFFPVSVLRILRLAKLARVSKVLRVFPELRLLIAGLLSSLSAIFWGTVLLMLCLLVWSMVAVMFIHPLNEKVDYGDGCSRCPRAYSSVAQASLTFWQQIVTGDSWGQATIPLLEQYPVTALYFVPVFLSVGMAVINLILGVVVSAAQQAKEDLEAEDKKESLMLKAEHHTHLLWLCMRMDDNGDGVISEAELKAAYSSPGEFRDALEALDITQEEIEVVWKVIDTERKGVVPYEDVVAALYSVKTSDSRFMLAYIKHYITSLKDDLDLTMKRNGELIIQKSIEGIKEVREEARAFQELKENIDCEKKAFRDVREDIKEVEKLEQGLWEALPKQQLEPRQSLASSCGAASAVVNDEVGTWLLQVCHRIATTRVELGDVLEEMGGKFEQSASGVVCNRIATTRIELGDILAELSGKVGPTASGSQNSNSAFMFDLDELAAARTANQYAVEKATV